MSTAVTPGAPGPASQTADQRAHREGRRRRPTGAPPPLPRKIGRTGAVWLILIGWLLVVNILWSHFPALLRWGDNRDTAVLRVIAHARVGWLTPIMRGIKAE